MMSKFFQVNTVSIGQLEIKDIIELHINKDSIFMTTIDINESLINILNKSKKEKLILGKLSIVDINEKQIFYTNVIIDNYNFIFNSSITTLELVLSYKEIRIDV